MEEISQIPLVKGAKKKMQVDVVSPEGSIFSGEATEVLVKGYDGELGIFPGHLQLLTSVMPGPMRIMRADGQEEVLFVAGGILEVQPTQVSVLADTVVRPQDVNETAAREAKEAAEQLLAAKRPSEDMTAVRYQLAEAAAKLRVLELIRARHKHR